MPKLIQEEPDTIDLDYVHAYFPKRFGITFFEHASDAKLRPTPANQASTTCLTRTTRTQITKTAHFFRIPKTISIVTWLCNK